YYSCCNCSTDPSQVTNVTVEERTTESLTVTWNTPEDGRKDNYTYNVRVTGRVDLICDNPKAQKCTVPGLEPGLQYNVSVQSVTPENTVSESVAISATTNPSPVTSISVLIRTTTSLTVMWTPSEDSRKESYTYSVVVTSENGTWNDSTPQGAEQLDLQGLQPGLRYNVSVYSVTPENTISEPLSESNTTSK
uniref:Receptor-type tyrosine-protein phosphatase H-like n=1 Tax=Callorhinchus milii TaxID=7868 RepID=A0A4W3GJQ4_CALMI